MASTRDGVRAFLTTPALFGLPRWFWYLLLLLAAATLRIEQLQFERPFRYSLF